MGRGQEAPLFLAAHPNETGIGHAAAAEISTDITWHGDRAAHFVNTMMSQGAVLVADTGLVRMRCKE